MKINYLTPKSDQDLQQILDLQKVNIPQSLDSLEMKEQGFVTVKHTLDILQQMNTDAPSAIAKVGDEVIAFALSMTRAFDKTIPVLFPFFDTFEHILWKGKSIINENFVVMGQVCVAKNYRGMGVFDGIYEHFKIINKDRFTFTITEINTKNSRSLAAHARVGFQEVYRYTENNGAEWSVVLWEF